MVLFHDIIPIRSTFIHFALKEEAHLGQQMDLHGHPGDGTLVGMKGGEKTLWEPFSKDFRGPLLIFGSGPGIQTFTIALWVPFLGIFHMKLSLYKEKLH